MSKSKTATTIGSAGIIACCVQFTPTWEGFSPVAHRDAIGTNHPMEYCYGQTDEFGKVKAGQRFTRQECDEKIKESFERIYFPGVDKCVRVALPVKTMASLVDGSYNAGVARMCASPMVAKINKGDIVGGCDAFDKWIVRSSGVVRTGLVARRAGEKYGDHRKSERALCLEGLSEPRSEWYSRAPLPEQRPAEAPARAAKLSWWQRLIAWISSLFGR